MLNCSRIIKLKKYCITIAIVLSLPVFFLIADKLWPLSLTDQQITQIVVSETGEPLWRFADSEGIWRYPVTVQEVSPDFLTALINYEDRWFYYHIGVNPLALLRAGWQYISHGRIISGGSTISMQVARLIEPHERTVAGKLRQIFRTLQLEWHLSKEQILTLYLNRAPYGGTIQGIGAASWVYLGKSPSELTKAEAVLLAVLPQAPSRFRPDRYPQRAQQARDKVLDRLQEYQVWDKQLIDEIRQEDVWLAARQFPQRAPLLSRRLVSNNQQHIIQTTLNAELQRRVEDMAIDWKSQLPSKTSLGIMIVDHTDMTVKAYVGSVDFNDKSRFGHVDMITAWRSPGSTLKPLLYAMAMDEGLIHSESLLQDVPRLTQDYRPGNFGSGFHGPVSAAESLLRSLNLPAVQLLENYGPKKFTAQLRNAGFLLRFPVASEPNLALILGGTAVKMEDLISAYSVFVRQGKLAKLRYTPEQPLIEKRLLSSGSAWVIRRILAGEGRPTASGQVGDVVPLAWKTGTSYGYRDAWAVGMNARYLIGVWVGRPDGTPVAGQVGNTTAVPLMAQLDTMLMNNERQQNRLLPRDPKPLSVSSQTICWPQGQHLTDNDDNCLQMRRAWVIDGTVPPTLHDNDPSSLTNGWQTIWLNNSGLRVAPDCPGAIEKRVALWPVALESWLQPSQRRSARIPSIDPLCPLIAQDNYSRLLILGIADNDRLITLPGKQELTIKLNSRGGNGKRWWFLNGDLIAELPQGVGFQQQLNRAGNYQLVLMDESGQVDRLNFTLQISPIY